LAGPLPTPRSLSRAVSRGSGVLREARGRWAEPPCPVLPGGPRRITIPDPAGLPTWRSVRLTLPKVVEGRTPKMSTSHRERKLVGPWRTVHALIWLVGLAILAWTNGWWPGILLLIGLSIILEAFLKRYAPHAFQDSTEVPAQPSEQVSRPIAQPPDLSVPPAPEWTGRNEWLPSTCPKCGAPTRGSEVRWSGPSSAECPYCGTNLPLKRT
jgi:hypothetical protein